MILIIMGVSGSGKTTVGQALAARLGWTFEDADDWHPASNVAKMRSGQPLTDADREPWLASVNAEMRIWLGEARNIVLACSALRASYRRALVARIEDRALVRFVYLKGSLDDIDPRLRERHGHFMPESLLKSQFETLEEPEPSEALVIDARQEVASVASAIIAHFHLDVREFRGPGSR